MNFVSVRWSLLLYRSVKHCKIGARLPKNASGTVVAG